MIEDVLPRGVHAVDVFGDRLDIELFAEEEAALTRAVDKRRHEFVSVRACAREALARLGLAAGPIVPGEGGAPTWPSDIVGSMTHCAGYRAAAVARSNLILSMGIDAEPNAPLPDGVFDQVTVADDLPGVDALDGTDVAADRLLFSAKESVYKAWYPLTGRLLSFEEVSVALRADGTFTARPLLDPTVWLPVDGAAHCPIPARFHGRWLAARSIVVTAVIVPA